MIKYQKHACDSVTLRLEISEKGVFFSPLQVLIQVDVLQYVITN